MAFLEEADLHVSVREQNLSQMANTATIDKGIATALQIVKDYMYRQYDVAQIFAKTGEERHQGLLEACRNIAVYKLQARLPQRQASQTVQTEYQETMAYLEKIANGDISLPLPRLSKEDGGNLKRRYLQLKKRSL